MTPLILDVDTGTDDAVAILLAALHPDLDLRGISTVRGNVPVEYTTDNTLRVLDCIDQEVPVYPGLAHPLVRTGLPAERANDGGGPDAEMHGLHLELPEARSHAQPIHGIDFLVRSYLADDGPDTVLVATGPLTNVAAALASEPRLAARIPRLIIMGGGHEVSNVTAAAEFNIWADPEAARVVLGSGITDITLVTLDATHKAFVTDNDCQQFTMLGTKAGQAATTLIERRIRAHDAAQPLDEPHAAAVHDALCIAHLVSSDVITTQAHHVDVEVHGELTVGRTVIDTHKRSGHPPNAKVALEADARKFVDVLTATLERGPLAPERGTAPTR